ncbi:MAG: thiamine phosphate synthase, partial [Gammaproteobacteria bacterium]
LTKNKLLSFASALKKLLDTFQIPLIINDNLELCLTLNADGLHLGQNDGDITIARNLLGPDKIIGLTINTIEQVEHANQLPIDYIGIGSIFPTQHKADVQNIWGITELSKAVGLSCHPTIAIGGINISNANEVMRAGVFGIAAIGAFHQTKNLTETIQKLKKIVEGKPI